LDNNLLTEKFTLPVLPSLDALSVNNNKISDIQIFLNNVGMNKIFFFCYNFFIFSSFSTKTKIFINLEKSSLPSQINWFIFMEIYILILGGDDDDYKRYRLYVLFRIPTLTSLDSGIICIFAVFNFH
jgi:Leucine-rich repeat (LRR) protein